LGLHAPAYADGFERCEIVVAKTVIEPEGGQMTVASYRPADDFLMAAKTAEPLTTDAEGSKIRGLICVRNDLVPTEADYPVLATGIPLSLSQDFDSADSDILTIYFDGSAFSYRYTSDYPMSGEFKNALTEKLSDFSNQDHGLVKSASDDN
jgi:hypothetical protein